MKPKSRKPIRSYIHLSRAWYGEANLTDSNRLDSISFGLYYPGDGCEAEMTVEWTQLKDKSVPYLHAFDDSWKALASFGDLLAAIAKVDNKNVTPTQFCAILESCGFKDNTPLRYEDSYPSKS